MRYLFSALVCFLMLNSPSIAQQDITLAQIWEEYKFVDKRVPGFNFMVDGKHYARLFDNAIKKYDITNGEFVEDIFSGADFKDKNGFGGDISSYTFNEDESWILIESEVKSIYRHSYTSIVHAYDTKTKTMVKIFDEPIMNATLSPDKRKVAFVFNNNIYIKDLGANEAYQITKDGKKNEIINGITDWVYEEEFAFVQAYQWSPDSKTIGYIKFNEKEVPEFTMTNYRDELYPEYVTWKYPKVGEKNAKVSVHLYQLDSKKTIKADVGDLEDQYIPRIKWTKENETLCIFKMNRHQNLLELYLTNTSDGSSKIMYTEKNKYYIDITDDLTFLEDGKHFVLSSEKSGFNHIYLFDMNGKEKTQLTSGDYDVTAFYGVDEDNKMLFYQAAEKTAMQKEIYSVSLKGKNKQKLSVSEGVSSAQFSGNYDYYVMKHSTINRAPSYEVYNRNRKAIRTIEDNKNIAVVQSDMEVTPVEFFDFETSEGVSLNGWMIKPNDFKTNRKYPVFMYLYGGPGSQQVVDAWKGQNYWWFQMLAQQGYIVACVDNRGTGARGEEFKKMTYLKLGHYETIDQIEAAKYLAKQNFTDESRIGIFGWSYGGYMSSLCLLKGNDVFKAAIAVAPVTSWKWYDTVYTERYMRTLEENEAGYKDNSPIYFADQLKGNYLLVHGMGDDNVHFQNSVEMANALIKANKQFDTYYYPNRNHGIYGGVTRLHLYQKMTDFIFEKL